MSRLPIGRRAKVLIMTSGLLGVSFAGYRSFTGFPEPQKENAITKEAQETLQHIAKASPYDTLDWKMVAGPLAGYFAADIGSKAFEHFHTVQVMQAAQDQEYGSYAVPSVIVGATVDQLDQFPIVSQFLPNPQTRKSVEQAVWLAKEIIVTTEKWQKWQKEQAILQREQKQPLPYLKGTLLEEFFGPTSSLQIAVWGRKCKESLKGAWRGGTKLAKGAEIGFHARRIHEVLQMRRNKEIKKEAHQLFLYNAVFVFSRSKKYLEKAIALLSQSGRLSFDVNTIAKICNAAKKGWKK
ncbi:MAG: hypothetical protein JSR80_00550 [Verrucomicrobia bacterium]|nr:hypothetical protein [Verrucomicrobiota bacterium]